MLDIVFRYDPQDWRNFEPPASQKDFIDLAEQLAGSPHIRQLLKNGG